MTPIDDYPFFDDPSFYQKLYHKKEFFDHRYKEKWWEKWSDTSNPFKHLPHQLMVYSMFGPHTPYMGIFLFHGCGSGKTFCATQIIESNKLFLDEHSTMALILVPNEMIMSSIIYELLGKEVMPDGTVRFKKKGTGDKYIDADLRDHLNEINSHQHTPECKEDCDKQQRGKVRKIIKYIKKEKLLQYYDIETHQRFAKIIESMSPDEINKILSNRVIVVDEIHKIRNQTSLYRALRKVVINTINTKFVFLSGTACVDREYDIIPIINLLRENDGHQSSSELMCEKDIRSLFQKDTNVRKKAELQFAKKIKGYVSFIRGMNPITFPIRIEMGTRFFKDVNFNTIDCYMQGKQLIKYLECFFDEFNPNIEANVTNELWEKTRCASRCAYEHTSKEDWLYENVWNISCKFSKMWENFKLSEGKGAIMIYAFNIEKGINLVEKFLRINGVIPFTLQNATTKTPKYINFSNIKNSELRQRALDICRSHENYKGEYIKYILGTGKIRTGITFKHLSQSHVVETDWNIPTTEQTTFRGARQFSHDHPIFENTNRYIRTFRYRSIISQKYINELPERVQQKYKRTVERYKIQLKKRGFLCTVNHVKNNDKAQKRRRKNIKESLISIDDFMYRTCLRKDILGSHVERLAKVYAIDNPFQINANFYPNMEDEQFEGSRIANYQSLEYQCPLPNEHNLVNVSKVKEPKPEDIDRSTHYLIDWVLLVHDTGNSIQYIPHNVFDSIIEMFNHRTSWKFVEFKALFRILFADIVVSVQILAYVLNWMVETQYKFHVSKNGKKVEGYIIYANYVYLWTSLHKIVQTSICDLIDITKFDQDISIQNNFETRYFSIHPHLEYNNAFRDIFGEVKVLENIDMLNIPALHTIDSGLCEISQSLSITLKKKNTMYGVIDNTKDNPNRFNLKLWTGNKKIAASSKKLSELKKMCKTLNIDTDKINRKGAVCIALQNRLISLGLMLPWAPYKIPSLYRIYLVAKAWEYKTVIDLIEQITNNIVISKGKLFVNAIVKVIALRRKNIMTDFPNIKNMLEDYFLTHATSVEFVLCLLERMHGARPTRLNDTEWNNIITEIYNQQFYQTYKSNITEVYNKMYQFIKHRPKNKHRCEPNVNQTFIKKKAKLNVE